MKNKDKVKDLLQKGLLYRHISKELGLSEATISYHAKSLGMSRGYFPKYDWEDIFRFISLGNTLSDTVKKYGMSKEALAKARNRGDIPPRVDKNSMSFDVYAQSIEGKAKSFHRRNLRRKLIEEGMEWLCAICGIKDWRGDKLCFDLDHIDGDGRNNDRTNLRFLCPNCHSQTKTWRGRNKTKY